jgi:hypothetical protein
MIQGGGKSDPLVGVAYVTCTVMYPEMGSTRSTSASSTILALPPHAISMSSPTVYSAVLGTFHSDTPVSTTAALVAMSGPASILELLLLSGSKKMWILAPHCSPASTANATNTTAVATSNPIHTFRYCVPFLSLGVRLACVLPDAPSAGQKDQGVESTKVARHRG